MSRARRNRRLVGARLWSVEQREQFRKGELQNGGVGEGGEGVLRKEGRRWLGKEGEGVVGEGGEGK